MVVQHRVAKQHCMALARDEPETESTLPRQHNGQAQHGHVPCHSQGCAHDFTLAKQTSLCIKLPNEGCVLLSFT